MNDLRSILVAFGPDTTLRTQQKCDNCVNGIIKELQKVEQLTAGVSDPAIRLGHQRALAVIASYRGYARGAPRIAVDLARLGDPEITRFVIERASECFWELLRPNRDPIPPFNLRSELSSYDTLWIAELVCKKLFECAYAKANPGLLFQEGANEGMPELLQGLSIATGTKYWKPRFYGSWSQQRLRRVAVKRLDKALARPGLKGDDATNFSKGRQGIAEYTIEEAELLML